MSISMYEASVPGLKKMLNSLAAILKKVEAHADSRKIEPGVFLNARLAPDMFPLIKQVQIATDHAKGCVARLAGVDVPVYEDSETTFEELQKRIAKTIAFLDSFEPSRIDGSEACDIILRLREVTLEYKGGEYLFSWVLPNFYFHVTTAYAILRHHGVDIGKKDFMGG